MTRAVLILSVLTLSVVLTMLFWVQHNHIREAIKRAESAADMADNVRAWMSKYDGGVYVKGGSNVSKPTGKSLDDLQFPLLFGDDGQVISFHQKNPFLALGEIFQVVEDSPSKIKIAMRSDNYMSDANRPSDEDRAALDKLRESQGQADYVAVQREYIYYARAIRATEACLKCHGDPGAAPEAVRAKFPPLADGQGHGYGYQVGDVVGVTSVRVPRDSYATMLSATGWATWLSIGIALAALVSMLLFVKWSISDPLSQVTRVAKQIATTEDLSKVKVLVLDEDEAGSRNEVHRLNDAIGRLRESISLMLSNWKA